MSCLNLLLCFSHRPLICERSYLNILISNALPIIRIYQQSVVLMYSEELPIYMSSKYELWYDLHTIRCKWKHATCTGRCMHVYTFVIDVSMRYKLAHVLRLNASLSLRDRDDILVDSWWFGNYQLKEIDVFSQKSIQLFIRMLLVRG